MVLMCMVRLQRLVWSPDVAPLPGRHHCSGAYWLQHKQLLSIVSQRSGLG